MSETLDRYGRLADDFASTLKKVPDDRWELRSPCEDWTARDVVKHVAETPRLFFGFVGREYADVPDDPSGAFGAARQRMEAALADPEVAQAEFDGFFGRSTFERAVDRFINFDLIVHRWDLAQAAGIDIRIDDADLDRIEATAKEFGDAMRGPGAFGPAVDPPPGADRQTRVMAFLGRKPVSA